MLTVALQHCGADPSFAIGGNLNESGANAHNGTGDVFVAEADESDGSFLLLHPYAAIVTNVEADHLDHYGTAEAVDEAFDAFAATVDPGGFLVACADDPGAAAAGRTAARGAASTCAPTARAPDADLRRRRGSRLDGTGLAVRRGRDGAAARAGRAARPRRGTTCSTRPRRWPPGSGSGCPVACLREGLGGFTGTRRRFELKGAAGGVRVYDDYAHHPTELAAELRAARDGRGRGRLVVAFQPHRYSRTAAFARGVRRGARRWPTRSS